MRLCGTYRITNTCRGIPYIGSSKDIQRRWQQHRHLLRKNTHFNSKLQAVWNKYGETAFAFEVIEYLTEDELQDRETYWIQITHPYNYNIRERANQVNIPIRIGRHHSPQTCAKISDALKGKKHRPYTDEEKLAQSIRLKGRIVTWGQKISMARKGKDIPLEARLRQAASLSQAIKGENNPNFGHKWNKYQRQKMSKTLETLKYDFVCDRCNKVFTAVTRSSYGGHRRKCLLYSST